MTRSLIAALPLVATLLSGASLAAADQTNTVDGQQIGFAPGWSFRKVRSPDGTRSFVGGAPVIAALPPAVWINKPASSPENLEAAQ